MANYIVSEDKSPLNKTQAMEDQLNNQESKADYARCEAAWGNPLNEMKRNDKLIENRWWERK